MSKSNDDYGGKNMEFKKCARCGCFFVTNGDVCYNCTPKDRLDIAKLKNYFEENTNTSINCISVNTGISTKNINRHLNNQNFTNIVE